jgi:dihydropteroate synthase
MGIVNVTPDSFSDGGLFLDAGAAVAHARKLAADGADILDIGGESTRPGAEPVPIEEELSRVAPVLDEISDIGAQISIDTSKAGVARAAIERGASIVNDVSALRADAGMAELLAETGVGCCLMHMRGEPRSMQRDPRYGDVVDEVKAFLEERLSFAVRAGVREEQIMLDPGIGFGKTVVHNLALLRRLAELASLGRPLVVGTSRKSFLGRILADAPAQAIGASRAGEARASGSPAPLRGSRAGEPDAGQAEQLALRLPGTIATNVLALERGASVFRVHDVAPVRAALTTAAATLNPRWIPSLARTTTS